MAGWRMQPTATVLGVIAIVMITITASETESGAIEHGINHLDEEDQRSGERIATNHTVETVGWSRDNDTTALEEVISAVAVEYPTSTKSSLSLVTVIEAHFENTSKKYVDQMIFASKRIEDSEQAEEALATLKHIEEFRGTNESTIEKPKNDWLTMMPVEKEEDVTEAKYESEQRNVEDIRAISFQVPPPNEEEDYQDSRQQGKTSIDQMNETRKLGETRKNQSRSANNLLLSGKSTKAFYEIKPSIRTLETERGRDHQSQTTTHKTLSGRKFVLPSVDSAFGKFGPYFEDGDREMNVTTRIGSTVLLDCKIGMLGNKEVTWLQHSKDSFRLLTVGKMSYSNDQRISLNFRYPSNWRLQILYASPRDSGLYQCQVATHPPLVKKINVVITAPTLTISDDSGRIVSKERHLKAGSVLRLRCEARNVLESLNESVVWTRGDETLSEDISENRTTEISAGKEVLVIVSTLIVERASPRHAGNYSCVVPGKAKTTVAVHVLNGELPAAVHDGNGVSRAFLNLWLVHLTMSYVFTR
ncbi:Zwei Ig domain protein zig-8 [Formica fusca]